MDFARVNGLTLHYRMAGRPGSPAIVLANSLGTDARIWDGVIAHLEDRYSILSYDKRGHGLSDAPSAPYSLDDHAADMEGLVDHLGIDGFALAGISVGGMIAQRVAVRRPGWVKALALCDTAARIGTAESWNERIEAVRTRGLAAIADAVLDRWFTQAFRRDRQAELAGWRNMLIRTPAEGYAGTCAALRDADLTAEVPTIRLRTLVVAGAEDRATPPDEVRALADLLPDARFEIIPDAGHIPSIEQPEKLAALMESYFREVGHV
ncbi:3-oxoadipate enol-lactonase [Inquilinus sp. CAU 1745]|uniref:3-oxoadipate enol-lactonase n=1 Tax=Inquilinus sp. CAU 1745 TaxID=3140369 RepID=UPI00325C0664